MFSWEGKYPDHSKPQFWERCRFKPLLALYFQKLYILPPTTTPHSSHCLEWKRIYLYYWCQLPLTSNVFHPGLDFLVPFKLLPLESLCSLACPKWCSPGEEECNVSRSYITRHLFQSSSQGSKHLCQAPDAKLHRN